MLPIIILFMIISLLMVIDNFHYFKKQLDLSEYDKLLEKKFKTGGFIDKQETFFNDCKTNDIFFLFKKDDGKFILSKKWRGKEMNWMEFSEFIKKTTPNVRNRKKYATVSDFIPGKFTAGVNNAINMIGKIIADKRKIWTNIFWARRKFKYKKSIFEKYAIIVTFCKKFISYSDDMILGLFIKENGINVFLYNLKNKEIVRCEEIDNENSEIDVMSLLASILCFNGAAALDLN